MFVSALRLCSYGFCDSAEVLLRLVGAEVCEIMEITVNGNDVPSPNQSFEESNFPPDVMAIIKKQGSVKNVNIIKCGKRSYHNNFKKTFFPKVNTYYGKNNIHISNIKYSTQNVNSAVSITNSFENRSTELEKFLEKHNIKVSGNNIANPFYSVEDAEFPESILSTLRKCNINEPTPIQSLSWPHGLSGCDFVGISKTGSGKTLGYIIPAIIHIKKLNGTKLGQNFPLALVLVPTRELAKQVENVARLFRDKSFRCVCLYGGDSRERQFREIQYGVDLCIATPGRILDFIEAGVVSLRQCSFLVLDEADRMLDMGFLPDLEKIINTIECKKQVLMWSATWPKEVKNVAERFLSDYVMIAVGSTELKPNANIRQIVKVVNMENKKEKLVELLADIQLEESNPKILIFAETKFNVDTLQYFLRSKRIAASAIHSGRTQKAREMIMKDFQEGTCSVLIATAVAARGLDIDNITHVINYDCPKYFEEYIHKIGRTARHEKTGTAITFVTSADTYSGYLLDVLKQSNGEIPKELSSIAQTRQLSFNAIHTKRKRGAFFQRSRRNDWY